MRIAIVEDVQEERLRMMEFLKRYEEENHVRFTVSQFQDGDEITHNYRPEYDLILMDIEMVFQDGMSAAREIREKDNEVEILFVTNASQYAMNGYEVSALDYLLKPITYYDLADRIKRALKKMAFRKSRFLILNVKGGFQKVEVSHIRYVETEGRQTVFHTLEGDFRTRDSIHRAEDMLKMEFLSGEGNVTEHEHATKQERNRKAACFFRCNKGCLVNLEYVDGITGGDIRIGTDCIQVSRAKKKAFLQAINQYILYRRM